MTPTMQILRRTSRQAPHLATSFSLFLLMLIGSAPPPAGLSSPATVPSTGSPAGPAAEVESSLRGTIAAIEGAFVRCDPSGLESILPRRMKIYLSTTSFGIEAAYYGPDQMLALMQRICEGRTTLRFTPIAAPSQPRRDADTTLTAQWISRASDGAEDDVRLAFVVSPEGSIWQIREVRQMK